MLYTTPAGDVAMLPARVWTLNTRHGVLHLRADAVLSVFVAHDSSLLIIETLCKTHHVLNDECARPVRVAFGIPSPAAPEPDMDPHEFGVQKFGADF